MSKVSVIICTYNRSEILKQAIISLINSSCDLEMYEIVVIDNNSNDNTFDVVSKLMDKYKNIKYFREQKQGLSCARNTGIRVSNNEILVFIDDDVLVQDKFVENIIEFFKDKNNATCGGGKIETIWNGSKPKWFKDGFFSIIGETKYGDSKKELTGVEYPYGGNMFFKKFIFEEVGSFNEELGLKGNELKMGEEVELFSKIRKLGYKIYYDPSIAVNHRVHLSKVNKEYINKRWIEEGKATGKILNEQEVKKRFYNRIKRIGILYLRDYPCFGICKAIKSSSEFYWKVKVNRSKAILENLNRK